MQTLMEYVSFVVDAKNVKEHLQPALHVTLDYFYTTLSVLLFVQQELIQAPVLVKTVLLNAPAAQWPGLVILAIQAFLFLKVFVLKTVLLATLNLLGFVYCLLTLMNATQAALLIYSQTMHVTLCAILSYAIMIILTAVQLALVEAENILKVMCVMTVFTLAKNAPQKLNALLVKCPL